MDERRLGRNGMWGGGGKIVIVTGSNSGIGKETALEMAKRGSIVIMACRDLNKAGEARKEILTKVPGAQLDILKLDLGDLASVREFAEIFKKKYSRLDILINNAGVVSPGIISVASMGALVSKIRVDDLNMEKERFRGYFKTGPYCNSKLANIIFVQELARRLSKSEEPSDKEVTCYALCPGVVVTGLAQNYGCCVRNLSKVAMGIVGVGPDQGCQTTLYCVLSKEVEKESGKMYRCSKTWDLFRRDEENGKELWESSEKLVGLEGFSRNAFKL